MTIARRRTGDPRDDNGNSTVQWDHVGHTDHQSAAVGASGGPPHTEPAPPPIGTRHSTFGRSRRANADYAKRRAKGAIKPPPTKPVSREASTALRDYLEPFTCLSGMLDPVFNRIHDTAVAHGVVPPAEIPVQKDQAEASPVQAPRRSLHEFLESVAKRNFLCAIQGEPCFHRPGGLEGKTIIIGYFLDEKDDIRAFEGLIEEHLREGDLVISPASEADLRNPAVRDQACFGAPAEQCVAIAADDITGRTGEVIRKLVDLALRRLTLIDSKYARDLEETHRAEKTEGVVRFYDYQNAASLLSDLTPSENRAAADQLNREISSAMREASSIEMQEGAERDARYAARIREFTDGERTIYVPVAMNIADALQREFIANPDVAIIVPLNSAQRL
jgi:hypothetical protein